MTGNWMNEKSDEDFIHIALLFLDGGKVWVPNKGNKVCKKNSVLRCHQVDVHNLGMKEKSAWRAACGGWTQVLVEKIQNKSWPEVSSRFSSLQARLSSSLNAQSLLHWHGLTPECHVRSLRFLSNFVQNNSNGEAFKRPLPFCAWDANNSALSLSSR